MDWLEGQEDYTRASCAAFDFDYLLGSVHFIGHWGFDDGADPWKAFSQEECEKQYQAYFETWERMILSGLFNIAAPNGVKPGFRALVVRHQPHQAVTHWAGQAAGALFGQRVLLAHGVGQRRVFIHFSAAYSAVHERAGLLSAADNFSAAYSAVHCVRPRR